MKIYSRAFSLLELLVVLGIVTIMLLIAVPNWQNFLTQNRATTGINKMVQELALARTEAIRRGDNATLCQNAPPHTAATDWSLGQTLADAHGKILRQFSAIPKGDRLIWQSSLGKNNCITATPLGVLASQQGSFSYCPLGKPKNALALIVTESGGTSISRTAQGGQPISCEL